MNRRTAARHRRREWRRQRHREARAAWLASLAQEREAEERAWRVPLEARRDAHRLKRRLRTLVRGVSPTPPEPAREPPGETEIEAGLGP